MPLKLLKRTSAQYNVVSKTTFVISVELLDNGTMECTLDADSTGKDCLLNISQRLGLHQPEFFGLRYISRGVPPRQRWVELERPLKKQLEKHAQDSQLSLGVMFYVADVNLLKDEMARYHYFLQLKSDVIDGKLNCNLDQAISLAAYSLQAEFGDYDPERHTIEYLRDFAILPKEFATQVKFSDISVDTLHEHVARQYGSLVGFPPPLAEIYYIMVAQQLDGYGQEAYPAKDDAQNDILICVGLNGLVIRRRDWTHVAVFRWSDIKSMVGHKRLLVVEKAQSQRTAHFHFTDPEVAKYVRKMCLLQSTFYKNHVQSDQLNLSDSHRSQGFSPCPGDQDGGGPSGMIRTTSDFMASGMGARGVGGVMAAGGSQYSLNNNCFSGNPSGSTISAINASGLNLNLIQHSMPLPPSSMGNTSATSLMPNPSTHFKGAHPDMSVGVRTNTPAAVLANLNGGHRTAGPNGNAVEPVYSAGVHKMGSRAQSASTDDPQSIQNMLPSYRQAPDYETAVQRKYGVGIGNHNTNSAQLFFDGQAVNQSDDEPIYQNEIVSQIHSIELRDSAPRPQTANRMDNVTITNITSSNPNINLQTSLGSLPQETQILKVTNSQGVPDDPHMYMYKPPPPYPGTKTESAVSNGHSTESPKGVIRRTSTVVITNSPMASESAQIFVTSAVSSLPETVDGITHSNELVLSKMDFKEAPSLCNTETIDTSVSSGSSEVLLKKSSTSSTDVTDAFGVAKLDAKAQKSTSAKKDVHAHKTRHHAKHGVASHDDSSSRSKEKIYGTAIDVAVVKEFEGIVKCKNNADFSTALKNENSKRNRFPNILPYEDNCVRLTPSRANPTGYINASPVSFPVSGREWKYIIGQIPLAGNAPAVWQMIWETGAKVVAILERDSTASFYPSSDMASPMIFSDYQITESKDRANNTATIAKELILTYLPKRKTRKVWLLPYEDEWKDDVPIHTEHFLCFLEEVNSVLRKFSEASSPLVVLCGTGAGRSGVLILSDLLLHAADSGHKLPCNTLLSALRNQRMMLVSSASQYGFVLQTLAKYLAQSRLI